MPRVKRGFKAKHRRNKVFKAAKGFRGSHSKLFTHATVAVDRALQYAYRDRRTKKRDFRKLWIIRINAAARENGISYSEFIHGLNRVGIDLDRKVLSDMAIHDPAGFSKIVEMVK